MALHGWGTPMWASEIMGEFGDPGGRPVWLTNFYRGGAYVPNINRNINISTAGYIAYSMFYGAAKNLPPIYDRYALNTNVYLGHFLTIVLYFQTGQRYGVNYAGYYYDLNAFSGSLHMTYSKYHMYIDQDGILDSFKIPDINEYTNVSMNVWNNSGRLAITVSSYPSAGNGWCGAFMLDDYPSGSASADIHATITAT